MRKTDVEDILKYMEKLGYDKYELISQFIIATSMTLDEAAINVKKVDGFDFRSVTREMFWAMVNRGGDFKKFISMENFIENIYQYRQYGSSVSNYFIMKDPFGTIFVNWCCDEECDAIIPIMYGTNSIKSLADERKLDPYKVRVWAVKTMDEYKDYIFEYCKENGLLEEVQKYL